MGKITVKSTIALRRNMDMYPFPAGLPYDASQEVVQVLYEAIQKIDRVQAYHSLVGMEAPDKEFLYHQGKITYNMVRNTIHSGLVEGEIFQYLLNDEDHLTIIGTGDLEEMSQLWSTMSAHEDKLSSALNFAFDLKLGFLTSRITEIGTGLKISVILHLPGIVQTDYMSKLTQAVHQVGFSLKPVAFEMTSKAWGLYELSNLITIGKTETEIIDSILELVERIEKKEKDASDTLLSIQDKVFEDTIYRAFGLLKNARLLSYEESVELLSKVRIGCVLGYFNKIDIKMLDQLFFAIHPKLLEGKQVQFGRKGDAIRAEYIQAHLGQSEV